MKNSQENITINEENITAYKEINVSLWKALERGEIDKPTLKQIRFRLFFEKIGFEIALDTENEGDRVVFLKQAGLVIETYENHQAVMKNGAIDHVCIDVNDIDAVYELAKKYNLYITNIPSLFSLITRPLSMTCSAESIYALSPLNKNSL